MSDRAADINIIARGQQQLRQEQATFDQNHKQSAKWFWLQLCMGWMAFLFLPFIAGVCLWVILNHTEFSESHVTMAIATLLVDTGGLVGAVWKLVFGKGPSKLEPLTKA